ncbi:MAG: hypothetical protein IJH34_15285 [Romboutsia sp.]|nr:hypothetical protein [Romboutsia sp.]
MKQKDIFLKEKENCNCTFYHIMEGIKDPALKEIDNLYGAADYLSLKNAERHRKILLSLSVIGTLITIAFFLYYEGEMHHFILLCIILLVFLFLIHKQANNMECHRKYLEYRVLAETLRVQFFLSIAGVKEEVKDIMPWFIKKGITWIGEILETLHLEDVKERQPILHFWVMDQKTYHEEALLKAVNKKKKQDKITKIAIYITILTYLAALIFEIYMYFCSPMNIDAHLVRISLKIVIGSMSVSTLFLESYYGKMSLSETIADYKRMILLYDKIEHDIRAKGESEEIILYLAKEFLTENSTWYAYQSKNKAEIVFL